MIESISIVIPSYNESTNIKNLIEEICKLIESQDINNKKIFIKADKCVKVSDILSKLGVTYACISPGMRNSALKQAFLDNSHIDCTSHVDERSSCFFALGLYHRPEFRNGFAKGEHRHWATGVIWKLVRVINTEVLINRRPQVIWRHGAFNGMLSFLVGGANDLAGTHATS